MTRPKTGSLVLKHRRPQSCTSEEGNHKDLAAVPLALKPATDDHIHDQSMLDGDEVNSGSAEDPSVARSLIPARRRRISLLQASVLLVFSFLPPLLMGLSGLYLRHRIRAASSASASSSLSDLVAFVLRDLLPQWLENAIFLAIGHRLCHAALANMSRLGRMNNAAAGKARSEGGASTTAHIDNVAMVVVVFGSVALLSFMALCAVVFSMADYVAQDEMGASPTLTLVVNTLTTGPAQVLQQQANSNSSYVGKVVASIIVPYAMGIALYAAGLRLLSSLSIRCRFSASPSSKKAKEVDTHINKTSSSASSLDKFLVLRRLAVGKHSRSALAVAIGMLLFAYSLGGYAPVTHIFLCTFFGSPIQIARATKLANQANQPPIVTRHRTMESRPGALTPVDMGGRSGGKPMMTQTTKRERPLPNVIMIIIDSLSGHLMSMDEGQRNMPFFHSNMSEAFGHNNNFQFRHARTTSGSSNTAMMGFMTGLIPFTDDGKTLIKQAESPAREFQKFGYETVLFNSLNHISHGHGLDHFKNCMEDGWDEVYGPESLKEPLVNLDAMDDRILVARFQQWLKERSERNKSEKKEKPFFLLHYWSNLHSPWTAVEELLEFHHSAKYFKLMTVIDDQIRHVYESVAEANLLNTTMVIGGADHGDRPGHWRQADPDSPFVLNVPLWMHVPPAALPDETERALLRKHADCRVVSNMDVMPTLRHMIGMGDFTVDESEHCLTGMDLLASTPTLETSSGNGNETARVQMVWAGPPSEDVAAIIMFIRKDRALSLHTNNGGTKSKEIGFHVDPERGHKASHVKSRSLEELTVAECQAWVEDIDRILRASKTHQRFMETKLPNYRDVILSKK